MASTVSIFPCEPDGPNRWTLGREEPIGERSLAGKVYQLCLNSKCRYAMKVIENRKTFVRKEIQNEVRMQNRAAEYELCKPVVDSWVCKDGHAGVIITTLLEDTVGRTIRGETERRAWETIQKLVRLLHQLHQLKIYHGDSHLDNFMTDIDGNLFFIDMGKSGELKKYPPNEQINLITKDYLYLADSIGLRYEYTKKEVFAKASEYLTQTTLSDISLNFKFTGEVAKSEENAVEAILAMSYDDLMSEEPSGELDFPVFPDVPS